MVLHHSSIMEKMRSAEMFCCVLLSLFMFIGFIEGKRCGICTLTVGVLDCSGLGLDSLKWIPHTCQLETVVLNLNFNSFTNVPNLKGYGWKRLDTVFLMNNPLNCDNVCDKDDRRIVSSCSCGKYNVFMSYNVKCVIRKCPATCGGYPEYLGHVIR